MLFIVYIPIDKKLTRITISAISQNRTREISLEIENYLWPNNKCIIILLTGRHFYREGIRKRLIGGKIKKRLSDKSLKFSLCYLFSSNYP